MKQSFTTAQCSVGKGDHTYDVLDIHVPLTLSKSYFATPPPHGSSMYMYIYMDEHVPISFSHSCHDKEGMAYHLWVAVMVTAVSCLQILYCALGMT